MFVIHWSYFKLTYLPKQSQISIQGTEYFCDQCVYKLTPQAYVDILFCGFLAKSLL